MNLLSSAVPLTGYVHGLVICFWKRSADPRACVYQPRVHLLGPTMGMQPRVWNSGAHHLTHGSRVQKTCCLFCQMWEDPGIS